MMRHLCPIVRHRMPPENRKSARKIGKWPEENRKMAAKCLSGAPSSPRLKLAPALARRKAPNSAPGRQVICGDILVPLLAAAGGRGKKAKVKHRPQPHPARFPGPLGAVCALRLCGRTIMMRPDAAPQMRHPRVVGSSDPGRRAGVVAVGRTRKACSCVLSARRIRLFLSPYEDLLVLCRSGSALRPASPQSLLISPECAIMV